METIYQKRWNIEVFHKNIKSNTALAKSPTITILTQHDTHPKILYPDFNS